MAKMKFRPPEPDEFVWTTEDERELYLSEIENPHLFYICRFLYHRQNEYAEMSTFHCSPFAPREGTIAADDADRMMEEAWEAASWISEALRHIEKEMLLRGMKFPNKPENKMSAMVGRIESIEEGVFDGRATLIKMRTPEEDRDC